MNRRFAPLIVLLMLALLLIASLLLSWNAFTPKPAAKPLRSDTTAAP